jgi:hypothetical protein
MLLQNAPTQHVDISGTRFAYRALRYASLDKSVHNRHVSRRELPAIRFFLERKRRVGKA